MGLLEGTNTIDIISEAVMQVRTALWVKTAPSCHVTFAPVPTRCVGMLWADDWEVAEQREPDIASAGILGQIGL